MSAPLPTPPGARLLFMGEQEDPEMDNLLARGSVFVYGMNRRPADSGPEPAEPAVKASRDPHPAAGHYVLNGSPARWVKCGCGRCYMGPCPMPVEAPSSAITIGKPRPGSMAAP